MTEPEVPWRERRPKVLRAPRPRPDRLPCLGDADAAARRRLRAILDARRERRDAGT